MNNNDLKMISTEVCVIIPTNLPENPSKGSKSKQRKSTSTSGRMKKGYELGSPTKALKEMIIPLILSGFGNMGAGIILSKVQYWPVFQKVPQLIILVPALLGLKGNVEMTLSSRLGTHSNLGDFDEQYKRKKIIFGNMALIQCQSSVIGFLAPIMALILGLLSNEIDEGTEKELNWRKAVMIVCSSVVTTNIANVILGSLMCFVVLTARKYNIDPDNIATPIAASIGDIVTMSLLSLVSSFFFKLVSTYVWIPMLLTMVLICLIPFWVLIAWRNLYTKPVLVHGWTPILCGMMLQNTGGAIMERSMDVFKHIATFQPIINGISGNLVAIQTSRISTYLHKNSSRKVLPKSDPKCCLFPWSLFCGESPHSKLGLILILISGPGQLPFIMIVGFIHQKMALTPAFFLFYYVASTLQAGIALYMSYCMVHILWRIGSDPDSSAIPLLTAFTDLLGSALLAMAFLSLRFLKDPNAIGNEEIISIDMLLNKTDHSSNFILN